MMDHKRVKRMVERPLGRVSSISVIAIFNALRVSSRRVRIRISALLRPRAIAQVAKSESTVGQGYLQNGGELFIGIGHVLG